MELRRFKTDYGGFYYHKNLKEYLNRLIFNNYKLLHQFNTDFSFIHLA